ncbi:DUF2254 domain-containing protein [Blastococcus goldschmidtiae]|uniref:DUF2254 domain-containing protein n=1 Tax=Blastococcus goldschmidtiae TaxID=3075546 RepID=A0ABU2K8T4_9ACTN|nr:DUF2254 domain-containing protein [Blastococcus sp. DSM 46792]MDT0276602.1 DUF2254 domain-containing protein [Blastococcus sp. DSM 46792]
MSRHSNPRGGWFSSVRRIVGGALWPLPTLAVLAAVGLAFLLPEVDTWLQQGEDNEPLAYVFGGGPSAARTVLSAIASSLISVTTLLFSLTIVTLQLASSQYSPRLLQTFVRDRVVQVCLGVLLGTFVFALVVLRTVRSADEAGVGAFVPRLSVTVALVLALASVGALVAFLSHQSRQLRVETMLRDVHVEGAATLRRLAGDQADDDMPDVDLPPVPAHARPLLARHSGFLVQVVEGPLLAAATEAGAVLRLIPRPGESVLAGIPVAWTWSVGTSSEPPIEELEVAVDEQLVLSYERAYSGDPSYGLRKLVDIAARALSPGINDPTTAVHALSHVSDMLGLAACRTTWHRRLADENGTQRLLVPSWDYPALLSLALTQPRSYGGTDPAVAERVFGVLTETAWHVRSPVQQEAVRRERDHLVAQYDDELPVGWTAEDVRRRAEAVDSALAGDWPRP